MALHANGQVRAEGVAGAERVTLTCLPGPQGKYPVFYYSAGQIHRWRPNPARRGPSKESAIEYSGCRNNISVWPLRRF